MADAMVTGRMPQQKKSRGMRILKRNGLSASQAVNMMFDRIIEDGDASFLQEKPSYTNSDSWAHAAAFIDTLPQKRSSKYDDMTKSQLKTERLASRGLI